MTFNELIEQIYKILPNATFSEDNDGQIIIHSNLKFDVNGNDETPLIDMGEI